MKKTLAALLSLCVVVLSPGLASWSAAAEVARAGKVAMTVAPVPLLAGVPSPLSFNNVVKAVSVLGFSGIANTAAPQAPAAALAAAAPTATAVAAATPGPIGALLAQRAQLSLPNDEAARLAPGQAREVGESIMDIVLGVKLRRGGQAVESASRLGLLFGRLSPFGARRGFGPPRPPLPPPQPVSGNANGPNRGKLLGAAAAVGRAVLAGAFVVGLQAAGVALLPGVFGMVPFAAVWAVSSGALLLPAAVFARYRLSLRDSPRLSKIKALLDVAIGAYAGAALVAAPALSLVLASPAAAIGLPLSVATGVGSALALAGGGARSLDIVLAGGVLAIVPALVGVGAGAIGIAPLLGAMALPAMTTLAFFLGPVIQSAESGEPFAVPGSLQKLRFPSFNWVMIGVVFALTTGFGAVYTNWAFLAWSLFGQSGAPKWDKRDSLLKNLLGLLTNFNALFLGLLAFTAATGFASPLTFLVLAFAPERAAAWTEALLAKFLPASDPAPSTAAPIRQPLSLPERIERRWPTGYHWLKTGLLLGTMAAMAFGMGWWVVGITSLLKNLAVAAVLTSLPLIFSRWLIKAVMKLSPATPQSDPEFYEIMTELLGDINAGRAAKGQKPIPLPQLYVSPLDIPNAAATGLSPNSALVFVTAGLKRMLLDTEELRLGLIGMLGQFKGDSEEYQVFRAGLIGAIPGVTPSSTLEEAAQAIDRADAEQLKLLGKRLLRGVLSHEFMHVMDRHMVTGTIGGAISSGVAFASYGIMWAVGHAKLKFNELKDRLLGRQSQAAAGAIAGQSVLREGRGARPQMLEPLSTAAALKALPALLRVFAALWAPTILQVTQMAGSRNNEAQADEDGARLSRDPAALALALGLLTTWRPNAFSMSGLELPRLAAIAHMMTVNPLRQLKEAGALPGGNGKSAPLGRADNFLLDLFLTHPDTLWRIRTLKKMADALGPPGLARLDPPAGDAPAQSRGVLLAGRAFGSVRQAWERFYRVLADPDRNRQFWRLTWAAALINIGGCFHYCALGQLLAPRREHAKRVSDNRAIGFASQLAATLLAGPLVDNLSVRSVLAWTHLARALLMAAVPLLFFHGLYFVAAFHAIIFAVGILQSAGATASAVALNRVLGDDESRYARANAVFNLVLSATGIGAPLLAGAFIVLADARWGLLAGNALAYLVYACLLLGASALYLTLRLPRGPPTAEGPGAPVPRGFGARLGELTEGLRLVLRSRFLRLYLLFSTFSVMMADPIVFSALPRYLADILKLSGPAQAGAFPLYLTAVSLGAGLASLAMALAKDAAPEAAVAGALSRLERQGRLSSWLRGASWLLYAGVFFAPSLAWSLALMTAAMAACGPATNIWNSLLQRVVAEEAPAAMGRVYAFMLFYQMAFSMFGSLGFGWFIAHASVLAAVRTVAAAMALMALLDVIFPFVIFAAAKDPSA